MELVANERIDRTARMTGWALLAQTATGMLAAVTIAKGIDINLSGDVQATASSMLEREADGRLRGHLAVLSYTLAAFSAVGQFLIIGRQYLVLTAWALALALGAASLSLFGGVVAMNGAELASNAGIRELTLQDERIAFAAIQAITNYTSFHMALALGSLANTAFFAAFLKSGRIPMPIAAWGLFASAFVAAAVVLRDFVPALANDGVTAAFLGSNLIALIATGVYLAAKGVRMTPS